MVVVVKLICDDDSNDSDDDDDDAVSETVRLICRMSIFCVMELLVSLALSFHSLSNSVCK